MSLFSCCTWSNTAVFCVSENCVLCWTCVAWRHSACVRLILSPVSVSVSWLFSSVIMGEVELSCRAFVKMYLHACLYPRCSINGLLLSSSSAGGAVCVTDCVPLLHSHLPLALTTQLALTQVNPLLQVYCWVYKSTSYSEFIAWLFCKESVMNSWVLKLIHTIISLWKQVCLEKRNSLSVSVLNS